MSFDLDYLLYENNTTDSFWRIPPPSLGETQSFDDLDLLNFGNDSDDLDLLNFGTDSDESNKKLETFLEVKHFIEECGPENAKRVFDERKKILEKIELLKTYIPRPPYVEYDKNIFMLLKKKFFSFFPMCRTIYKNKNRYSFIKKKSYDVYIDVDENPYFTYPWFKQFLKDFYPKYQVDKKTVLDLDIFCSFVKWTYFIMYRVRIRDYIEQVMIPRQELLLEADIERNLPIRKTKNSKKVYLLNLFHNYKSKMFRLKELKNFTVLGYIFVEYPRYKHKKKKKIIWKFGKQISKVDKKDTIIVFLKNKTK